MQHTRNLWRTAALLVAVAAGALYLAARPDGYAADKSDPPKAAAGPLDFVPADSLAVLTSRSADYWDHPLNKAARDALLKGMPDAFQTFRKQMGVAPDEIDRVTLFVPPPGQNGSLEPLIAVTTTKPYDQKAVAASAAPDAKERKVQDHSLYVNDRGQSLAFLDDHTFLMGQPDRLEAYLKRPEAKKDGPLAAVLKLAGEKHYLVAGVDVAALAKTAPPADRLPPDFKLFKPLLKAQLAVLTAELDDSIRANLKVTFADEADAKDGAAAVDDALDLARGGLVQMMKQMSSLADIPKTTAVLKDVQAALRAAKAEQKGTTVEVAASLKIDPQATSAALAEAAVKISEAAKRMQITNDLKQLVLAMHNYHDNMGTLPPAAICDKNGKPLLSWRVAILPYIEQDALYKQFHLDEPWDSDHNKKLLEKMPPTFAPADSEAFKKHETFFQVFVGKDTPFETAKGRSLLQIPDGLSNTLAIVDAAKSVPWTKPEDIPFDEGKLLPKVGGLSKGGGFIGALCDGSVRTFAATITEETLHALVTANGGEVIPDLDK